MRIFHKIMQFSQVQTALIRLKSWIETSKQYYVACFLPWKSTCTSIDDACNEISIREFESTLYIKITCLLMYTSSNSVFI